VQTVTVAPRRSPRSWRLAYAGAMTARGIRTRPGPPGSLVTDLACSVGLYVVLVVTISLSSADSRPGVLPYLVAAGFALIALVRRRFPVTVLLLSALGVFAYYTLDLPPIGVAVPLVLALFSAAEAGRKWWSAATGAVVLAVALGFRLRDDPLPLGVLLGPDAVSNLALIAASVALGEAVRSSRLVRAREREIVDLVRQQAESDVELRIRAERLAISRDLHDSVGHALSVVALHSGVGEESVGRDDDAQRRAFAMIREQSTTALRDVRAMVRALRAEEPQEGGAEAHDVLSVADLPTLVERARTSSGPDIDLRVDPDLLPGGGAALSASVGATVYRVVQEGLTNVVRHAEAAHADVSVERRDGCVYVAVSDDGRGESTRTGTGVGLVGLRERVRLLGGDVEAGTGPGGGFTVSARIPERLGS
jgi:signal transduction histidine kinase